MSHSESRHDRGKLAHRMAKIEGHTRAVMEMIREDRDCPEVLHQIRSIIGAWQHLSAHILDEHLKTCVREAVASGRADEAVENLRQALLGRAGF
ncbi:MAG: metal-sensitive transcriptional regulator [Bacillota bacterium]|nr:metal-sensitive transcriptional regulator [Bacillota bacterium]